MTAVSEQTGAWLAGFTNQPPAAPWLQTLRDAAFARFAKLGFPTTHDEEWRFTNVAPIARTTFVPGTAATGHTQRLNDALLGNDTAVLIWAIEAIVAKNVARNFNLTYHQGIVC